MKPEAKVRKVAQKAMSKAEFTALLRERRPAVRHFVRDGRLQAARIHGRRHAERGVTSDAYHRMSDLRLSTAVLRAETREGLDSDRYKRLAVELWRRSDELAEQWV